MHFPVQLKTRNPSGDISMKQRRFLLLGTAAVMAGTFALPMFAHAQGAYPNRPIKFVVP